MKWLERYSLGPYGWKGGILASVSIIPIETYARFMLLELDPGPPFLYYLPGYWIAALIGGLVPGIFCSITSLIVADLVFIEPTGGIALLEETPTVIRGGLNCLTGIAFSIAIHHFQWALTQLKRSNELNSLLRREVNHRVGNFLQTIMAICTMQKLKHNGYSHLDVVMDKLNALSKVHILLQAEDEVFNAEHVRNVIASILHMHNCKMNIDSDVQLDRHQVQPFMMILSELVLNTYKHQNHEECEISVCFKKNGKNLDFEYYDTNDGEPIHGKGLGVQIIEAMAQQLGGEAVFANKPKVRIKFPV